MKAHEYLSNLAEKVNAAREADPIGIVSSISGIADSVWVSLTNDSIKNQSVEFKQGLVAWFLSGRLTTYRKTSTAIGARKNSRKKETTQYFIAERDGLKVQFGHVTTLNYQPDFWEMGGRLLAQSVLCKEGEFSYSNKSYIDYALELGAKFEDLGER